jgi:hypothetical protein
MKIDQDKKSFVGKKTNIVEKFVEIRFVVLWLNRIALGLQGRPEKRNSKRRETAGKQKIDVGLVFRPIFQRPKGKVRRQLRRRPKTNATQQQKPAIRPRTEPAILNDNIASVGEELQTNGSNHARGRSSSHASSSRLLLEIRMEYYAMITP